MNDIISGALHPIAWFITQFDNSRTRNEKIARRGGYFWLPCDLCGRMWGGHEWTTADGIHQCTVPAEWNERGVFSHMGICPVCTITGIGDIIWEAFYNDLATQWGITLTPDDNPMVVIENALRIRAAA